MLGQSVVAPFRVTPNREIASATITVSGTPILFQDGNGSISNVFELVVTGSPASLTVNVYLCMRGQTCGATPVATSSGTGSQILTASGPADNYEVVTSWTGGTSPTVTINRTAVTSRNSSGQGVGLHGTLTAGNCLDAFNSTSAQDAGAPCSGSSGANVTLSNLTTVALNASLFCASSGSCNLGSSIVPFGSAFINTVNNLTLTSLSTGFSIAGGTTSRTLTVDVTTSISALAALTGATFTGEITTVASATGGSGFNLPHGTAPTSPVNGDLWTTTSGLFMRVNGATVGPLTSNVGTVTSVSQTVPSWLTVGGSPLTTSGTLAITAATAQTSHQVIGTCGSATSFAPCALVAGDIPTLTPSQVGLGSVTNNAQTQAAIVPNTAPSAGQLLLGNAGGTAYAPVSMGGDGTITSAGVLTVTKTNGSVFGTAALISSTCGGDLSGTLPSCTVAKINTVALPTLTASTGILYDTSGTLSLTATLPTAAEPAHTGDMTNTAGSLATTVGALNGTALSGLATGFMKITTSTGAVSSVSSIRSISFPFGTPGGSAISTGILGYMSVPFACTISGWSISVDAGTATVKTLKVAAGTAIPTLGSNSISTSGVAISTGTVIQSTTLTDFTTTTVTANDIVAADLITTSGVGYINFQISCAQ